MKIPQTIIVQAALTGAAAKDVSPHLPVSVADNIKAGVAAWQAGAAVLHIHARDAEGVPTQDYEWFEPIVDGLRAAGCEAILNLSTGSAGGRASARARYECLRLHPEMASFDCGSVNMGERVFANPLPFLRALGQELLERNIKPEIECFDAGHIHTALKLRDEGLLAEPLHFQFVLGVQGGALATPEQLMYMRSLVPADATWSVCAVGAAQLRMNLLSPLLGGHVRTGLEDNIYLRRGELATSNAQLVQRIVNLLQAMEYQIATPAQTREILALEQHR
ncbi:MAG: 3-keto-5-aminohexanoate cleavage protein [Gammaproteobacteria bacterium]|nr:3-keto-5-aminohexanoate cleavage protein [Gammaproteobacteria bacterium]